MSLGKEQFLFAVAGRGWQGRALAAPHSQERQPAHSVWSDTAVACLHTLQSPFPTVCTVSLSAAAWGLGRDAHAHVTGGWWLREVEARTQVTQHVSRRAKIQSQV